MSDKKFNISLKEDFEEFKENMDDMNETFQETHKQIS